MKLASQTCTSWILANDLLHHHYLQMDLGNDVAAASVVAFPRMSEGSGSGVPLWVILVAVAAGLVVVTLITLALWKLGFFRRNRLSDADLMLSAKLSQTAAVTTNGNYQGVAVFHDHDDEYVS